MILIRMMATLLFVSVAAAGWARAQTVFPNRVVRVIVPNTSGGGAQTLWKGLQAFISSTEMDRIMKQKSNTPNLVSP